MSVVVMGAGVLGLWYGMVFGIVGMLRYRGFERLTIVVACILVILVAGLFVHQSINIIS